MRENEKALAAELSGRHGVTTTIRLADLGIGKRSVDALVRQGRLRRVGNGVLVCTCTPSNFEQRMVVACAITGGVVRFPTAGIVWLLRKTPRVPEIHLSIAETRRIVEPTGVRIHRTRYLPEADVVRRVDGIDVTSPPRTAVDAATILDTTDLESLIEHGIDSGYFTITTVKRVATPLCGKGWPGSGRLNAVLQAREPWLRPVRSDYELRLERAMRSRGFPRLVREHRLVLTTGEVIHPDLGIPEHNFYVEVDHLTWHGRHQQLDYDVKRDRRARSDGYHIERVTNLAIDHDLAGTVEDLWTAWQRVLRSDPHRPGTSDSAETGPRHADGHR